MFLLSKSLQSITAFDRQEVNAVFRKTWSWKDCWLHYVFILVVIAIVFAIGPSYRLLTIPIWMYSVIIIAVAIVDIIFYIMTRRKAAKKEDELIEYLIANSPPEDQTCTQQELRDRLLCARNIQAEPEEM